ncbi:hypothetical protein PROFUN_12481 [Planoprotostelium fungivorum]|uniref:Actin-related protein 5 n=1 Tax=Planoprotostelium fungivorum TaxID=1890364 RepID=A0A2P6N7E8_9EUKA|nr:hypothetical protein PROFUN_12481 [Planoprotostelium fungivorum]
MTSPDDLIIRGFNNMTVHYLEEEGEKSDDPIFSDAKSFKDSAIVVDMGSHSTRAGWSKEELPRLHFPTLVGRGRATKDVLTVVGNDLKKGDISKLAAKSPFEENVVYHFDLQEAIMDHIFSRLGCEGDSIINPVIMSESACNPNHCRKNTSELLFECYGVPAVSYGIDGLFSYYANCISTPNANREGLIISSGHSSTHILPMLQSGPVHSKFKRIDIGGYHCTDYAQKLVQIKYPIHRAAMTVEKSQTLKENHTYLATNYNEELFLFSNNSAPKEEEQIDVEEEKEKGEEEKEKGKAEKEKGEEEKEEKEEEGLERGKARVIQLPYVAAPVVVVTEEEKKRKHDLKVTQGQRLKEYGEKKRKEKQQVKEQQLERYNEILNMRDEDLEQFNEMLLQENLADENALNKAMEKLKNGLTKSENNDEEKAQRKKNEMDKRFEENPTDLIRELREKKRIIEEMIERKARENSSTVGGRNTLAKRKRMKAITGIAFNDADHDTDDFGMNDDDWDIYLQAGSEPLPEEQEEAAELVQIDAWLAKYEKKAPKKENATTPMSQELDYQLYIGVERIRIPEILFQPNLIGMDFTGLSEALQNTFSSLTKPQLADISKRIFVCGGNSETKLFRERIEAEVRALLPVEYEMNVLKAKNALKDAWRGASMWSRNNSWKSRGENNGWITKKMYEELGHDYLKEFMLSNQYLKVYE